MGNKINNRKNQPQLNQSLNNLSIKEGKKEIEEHGINKMNPIDKKFDYQQMQQLSEKQIEYCYAIAFNEDASILIAGCSDLIRVFEFKVDKLREIQQKKGHSSAISCLKFMKYSNHFISTSKELIIWKFIKNNQWHSNQILQAHTSYIWCFILNSEEDMLISGSGDYTIRFWQKQDNNWISYQQIDCLSCVNSISLNDQEDKLIASISGNQILVMQIQGKQWKIKQKILVEQYGYRLCFINQNQFIFQPRNRQHLQIFDYDEENQNYIKKQELQYQNNETVDTCCFPIQNLSHIGLILVKNGYHIHLIKRNQDGQLTVEQSIHFNTHVLYGCITDDGRHIATWDDKSKEIQIRKFQF